MSKIELDPINSGYNLSKINSDFQAIEDELNNKVLYRSNPVGEPNSMESDLDMNSRSILNASKISSNILEIGGVQVVSIDLATDPYNGTRESLRRSYADAGYIMVPGSFEAGGTVTTTTDVLLYEGEGKAYSWGGTLPKVTPAGSTPSSSGGIGASAWIDRSSETLRVKLNANTGATLVRTASGKTVQQELDKFGVFVSIADYPDLKAAIAALPVFGGTVRIPIGRFQSGDWTYNTDYMNKAHVTIEGQHMPTYNDDLSALVGGSIIQGRFNAWADNLTVQNVGFDNGKTYLDATRPGANTHVPDPITGSWDAFAFASPQDGSLARKNLKVKNVIGLLYDSLTVGHAVLMEGARGGSAEDIIAIYGIHGAVVKAMDFNVYGVSSFAQGSNGFIIKSDTFAPCGRVRADALSYMPYPVNTTPWYTPPALTDGAVNINAGTAAFQGGIQIGRCYSKAPLRAVLISGAFDISDVQIDQITVDGHDAANVITTDYTLLLLGTNNVFRVSVGSIIANNCKQVIYNKQKTATNEQQLHVNSVYATNILNSVVYGISFSKTTIDNLEINGAKSAYYWGAQAKIYVGNEKVSGLTSGSKFDLLALSPQLINAWTNFGGGNDVYDFSLRNYKASLKGLIAPGTSAGMVSIPSVLQPSGAKRLPIMYNAAVTGTTFVGIASTVQLNNGAIPAGTTYLSLEGVEWDY